MVMVKKFNRFDIGRMSYVYCLIVRCITKFGLSHFQVEVALKKGSLQLLDIMAFVKGASSLK